MIAALQEKKPTIDDSAFVADNATVVGDVKIDAECSVWYGAVIRGDLDSIRIGEGSNIQDNVTLHSDEGAPICIGRSVSVGHNAVVHGAVIGDNTLVGMNATVLNGAVIGENCIIGAGAVVSAGARFPAGSLIVGCPAKEISELYSVQIEGNRKNSALYRDLAKKHKALCK